MACLTLRKAACWFPTKPVLQSQMDHRKDHSQLDVIATEPTTSNTRSINHGQIRLTLQSRVDHKTEDSQLASHF